MNPPPGAKIEETPSSVILLPPRPEAGDYIYADGKWQEVILATFPYAYDFIGRQICRVDARPDCPSCKGWGVVDTGGDYGCSLENCPDCITKE